MTPDERVVALKTLLERLRQNAGVRLGDGIDEDEFLSRSTLEARAAEASLATDPPPPATERVDDMHEAPSIEMSEELELDLFDPFEDADMEDEDALAAAVDEELVAGELELHQLDDDALVDDDTPPSAPRLFAPPAAASRIVATGTPREDDASDDDDDDDDDRAELELELTFEGDAIPGIDAIEDTFVPRRTIDPLATTASNPIPAVLFERALSAEASHESSRGRAAERAVDTPDPDDGVEHDDQLFAPDEEAVSSRQPLDERRAADDDLDSEPPPESGEVASQRQPAAALRAYDLDGPTPSAGDGDRVAREIEARFREDARRERPAPIEVIGAPPLARPTIVGRPRSAPSSFLAVLDAALAFGERDG